MSNEKLLKKKIGKDDVILLRESLLPERIRVIDGYGENDLSQNKDYVVIAITWKNFSNRERLLSYIILNDRNVLELYPTSWFTVIT